MQTAPPLSPACRAPIETFSHPRLIILTENNPFTPWWLDCKLKDGRIFLHYPGHPPLLSVVSYEIFWECDSTRSLFLSEYHWFKAFICFYCVWLDCVESLWKLNEYTAHLYWSDVYICIYFLSLLLNETHKSHPEYGCWSCDPLTE